MNSIDILHLMHRDHGFVAFKDLASHQPSVASKSSVDYVHKEHKHRVQAFVMKTVKKRGNLTLENLQNETREFFDPSIDKE